MDTAARGNASEAAVLSADSVERACACGHAPLLVSNRASLIEATSKVRSGVRSSRPARRRTRTAARGQEAERGSRWVSASAGHDPIVGRRCWYGNQLGRRLATDHPEQSRARNNRPSSRQQTRAARIAAQQQNRDGAKHNSDAGPGGQPRRERQAASGGVNRHSSREDAVGNASSTPGRHRCAACDH